MSDAREYAVPFVAAIIERFHDDQHQVLIQIRFHTTSDSIYNGTFEFAAGTLDKLYEDVYTAVKREVKEETNLIVKRFVDDVQTKPVSPHKVDLVFGFKPFFCTQQLKEGKPWVGFIFRCEVEDGEPAGQETESRDVLWMSIADFKKIFDAHPEKIFSLEYPAWEYYFETVKIDSQENSSR